MKHFIIYYNHILDKIKLQLLYMNCDSFVLSFETQLIKNDLENIENFFDFSNLNQNHNLFRNKNKIVVGKFKKETTKEIWIDELITLKSKAHSFECGNENTNKLKGIPEIYLKNFKFEEFKKCSDREEYQSEGDNYTLKTTNHELYLQKQKSLHYLISMIKGIFKVIIKVNHGSEKYGFVYCFCN